MKREYTKLFSFWLVPLVLCLIGHVVPLPFYIIYVAGRGFSHLYSFLVLQTAISIQLLSKHSKQLKKIPFLGVPSFRN